jgi:hypothetical protein
LPSGSADCETPSLAAATAVKAMEIVDVSSIHS